MTLVLFVGCAHRSRELKERAALHLQIGTSDLASGNYPAALGELLKAEELDPQSAPIHNGLGIAYAVRGRIKDSETHYKKAIELNNGYTDARTNYARLLIELKRYDEALRQLSTAENDLTYPDPEKVLSLTGMVYFYEAHYGKAEEYLGRAMTAHRDSCVTSNFYGRTLMEEKKYEHASGILDLAVENCRLSKFEEPLFFSAMAYYSLGEKEKSKARLTELLTNYPRSTYVGKAKGLMNLLE